MFSATSGWSRSAAACLSAVTFSSSSRSASLGMSVLLLADERLTWHEPAERLVLPLDHQRVAEVAHPLPHPLGPDRTADVADGHRPVVWLTESGFRLRSVACEGLGDQPDQARHRR